MEMIDDERWRPVKSLGGLYEVSDRGKVRSVKRKTILKETDNGLGYMRVMVSVNGKYRNVYVHRLVAEVFVDNPNHYDEINHIDENKTNNVYTNLEWCTHLYNMRYGRRLDKARETKYRTGSWDPDSLYRREGFNAYCLDYYHRHKEEISARRKRRYQERKAAGLLPCRKKENTKKK